MRLPSALSVQQQYGQCGVIIVALQYAMERRQTAVNPLTVGWLVSHRLKRPTFGYLQNACGFAVAPWSMNESNQLHTGFSSGVTWSGVEYLTVKPMQPRQLRK
jgi:hypothetical protein